MISSTDDFGRQGFCCPADPLHRDDTEAALRLDDSCLMFLMLLRRGLRLLSHDRAAASSRDLVSTSCCFFSDSVTNTSGF